MLFKSTIDAKKHGIYTAVNKKNDIPELSDKSVNKLLQVLHDDLIDINNVYCTYPVYDVHIKPAALLIRHIVRCFIIATGEKGHDGLLIPEERFYFNSPWLRTELLPERWGYESCKILLERMLSKYLFVFELAKAKELLEVSPFLSTDPNRREILTWVSRIESKAQQQKKHVTELLMAEMLGAHMFRNANSNAFNNAVQRVLSAQFCNDKAKIKFQGDRFSFKRKVKKLNLMSTALLKEKIEDILFDNTGEALLFKEMSLLDRLVELHREDQDNYPRGKKVTLFYTGVNDNLDWWTAEECEQEGFPAIRATTKEIPSEYDYMMEAEQLRIRFALPPRERAPE
ncbi:hypothetical protein [Enterobacter sp. Bisph1]|uniref:hypothetical protein n=1 Tax=Enterobacter sp. Bisph1 TaxID=1274399 RepID=UPI00057C1839|nr:hypothetical protein [Enterobacter sp. Bisph1]